MKANSLRSSRVVLYLGLGLAWVLPCLNVVPVFAQIPSASVPEISKFTKDSAAIQVFAKADPVTKWSRLYAWHAQAQLFFGAENVLAGSQVEAIWPQWEKILEKMPDLDVWVTPPAGEGRIEIQQKEFNLQRESPLLGTLVRGSPLTELKWVEQYQGQQILSWTLRDASQIPYAWVQWIKGRSDLGQHDEWHLELFDLGRKSLAEDERKRILDRLFLLFRDEMQLNPKIRLRAPFELMSHSGMWALSDGDAQERLIDTRWVDCGVDHFEAIAADMRAFLERAEVVITHMGHGLEKVQVLDFLVRLRKASQDRLIENDFAPKVSRILWRGMADPDPAVHTKAAKTSGTFPELFKSSHDVFFKILCRGAIEDAAHQKGRSVAPFEVIFSDIGSLKFRAYSLSMALSEVMASIVGRQTLIRSILEHLEAKYAVQRYQGLWMLEATGIALSIPLEFRLVGVAIHPADGLPDGTFEKIENFNVITAETVWKKAIQLVARRMNGLRPDSRARWLAHFHSDVHFRNRVEKYAKKFCEDYFKES